MKVNTKKIINEFNRIKELGFVKNTKPNHGDGTAGNTFETYLGVKENNLRDPDFEEFEVKTKKSLSGSWTTLFSKKPNHSYWLTQSLYCQLLCLFYNTN